jgi:hypothetical protein
MIGGRRSRKNISLLNLSAVLPKILPYAMQYAVQFGELRRAW